MREIRTSGSTRGEWVVLLSDIAHSPTLLAMNWFFSHLPGCCGRRTMKLRALVFDGPASAGIAWLRASGKGENCEKNSYFGPGLRSASIIDCVFTDT
jgi:hypothetical protein